MSPAHLPLVFYSFRRRPSYHEVMPFDPAAYGSEVASILALDANGERLMPLVQSSPPHPEARTRLDALAASRRIPESALAGLYLYFSFWNEAHEIAQSIESPEGSYWHAIVHRQEPDVGNSAYWFRRVGAHAIFPDLRDCAAVLGFDPGSRWNPTAFTEYCEQANRRPGSEAERIAQQVQRAEWQLLFDYCASRGAAKSGGA
jgi:hypothetical protein